MSANIEEVKITKILVMGAAALLISVVLGITVASMHGDIYHAENVAANAEYLNAQTKLDVDKNNAIIKLIEDGTNPIAARCAIIGFDGTDLCGMFVPRPGERLD